MGARWDQPKRREVRIAWDAGQANVDDEALLSMLAGILRGSAKKAKPLVRWVEK